MHHVVDDSLLVATTAARVADAQKATDVLVLAVGEVIQVAEYFVVAGASNRRLVDAVVEEVELKVRESTGRSPMRVEGVREQQWVLIDYGDVVVHVFLDEVREFYEIERLYRDVPRIDWTEGESDGPSAAERAG